MPRIRIKEDDEIKLGELFVEAWTQPAARLALVNNPIEAMRTAGIDVSDIVADNVRIVVIEDTLTTRHLIMAVDPREVEGDPDAIRNLENQPGKLSALGRGAASGCK